MDEMDEMGWVFIPFHNRMLKNQRFPDDTLTQRDIGLTAIFIVRQAVMEPIMANYPNDGDVQNLVTLDDVEFFGLVLGKVQASRWTCFNRWEMDREIK